MPSPLCTVNGSATPQDVAASSTPTIALANTSGAQFWTIHAINADDTTNASTVDGTIAVNFSAKTATYTSPGLGTKVVFQSIVGVRAPGLDANGVLQPSYFCTFAVNVLTSSGLRVLALNEVAEQGPAGWIIEVNAGIRASGGGGSSVTEQRLSSAGAIVISVAGKLQPVSLKTGGGAFTASMPSPVANAEVEVNDVDATWQTHAARVSVGASVSIEDPSSEGTYVTNGTLTLPQIKGASYSWRYWDTETKWKLQ